MDNAMKISKFMRESRDSVESASFEIEKHEASKQRAIAKKKADLKIGDYVKAVICRRERIVQIIDIVWSDDFVEDGHNLTVVEYAVLAPFGTYGKVFYKQNYSKNNHPLFQDNGLTPVDKVGG